MCLCYLLNCDMDQVTGLEICFDCLLIIKKHKFIHAYIHKHIHRNGNYTEKK